MRVGNKTRHIESPRMRVIQYWRWTEDDDIMTIEQYNYNKNNTYLHNNVTIYTAAL